MSAAPLRHALREDAYPSRILDKAQWIARKDAAAYPPHKAPGALDAAQRETFERDGFIVIEDTFAPEEVALLQDELAAMRAHPKGLSPETVISEPVVDHSLRSIFSIHTQSALFKRLASDARLVDIARNLLGDEVYIHQSRLNYKPGFDGKEFYWHSDFETWHVEDGMPRMRALSMSLLLTDNTPHNGPLMLIPGSHKFFIACVGKTPEDHYKQSLRKQEYGVPDRESLERLADAGGISAPLGRAGALIIFDCNMMHGSNGNITPAERTNAFLVYNAVSNALEEPFGATAPRPDFIATRSAIAPLTAIHGTIGRM